MKYLVDVNVLSEPTRPAPDAGVVQWLKAHRHESVTCAPAVAEIWRGIHTLPDGKRKAGLSAWFHELRSRMPSLDWTTEAAVLWAELVNDLRRAGFTVGVMDTLIASLARLHGLTVATRNVDDFTRCGVPVVNPFEG
jgi:toxin FitB